VSVGARHDRPVETDADVRIMQQLTAEVWRLRREKSAHHVGDLAWGSYQHVGREQDRQRRVWLEGQCCVAWAWVARPAELTYEVHPDYRGAGLHDGVLEWFAGASAGEHHVRALAEPVGVPELPVGFKLRTVRGERDLEQRVAIHRTVWAPSRVTAESYHRVMAAWPYRADLDCVVEAPGGTFAAYVLAWYDEANRAGEFEPVGTHPEHRRRGLGAAVCLYALERLRAEGAGQAVVYTGGRLDDEPARRLYESIGFRRHTRLVAPRSEG